MFWTSVAHAMAGGQPAGGGEASAFTGMVPIILMFAVFYFLLIRPQQKKAKEHKAMVSALKRGDEVITSGGLYGRIVDATDEYLILDLGETRVKISRSSVTLLSGSAKTLPPESKKKREAREASQKEASQKEAPQKEAAPKDAEIVDDAKDADSK